ncbi:MAG TPA: methionine aminotransferase, partial [Sphingobacteriaceae bacterium]|nr:methionine aminotransferase [Sphingobacteriaceae bacterium]
MIHFNSKLPHAGTTIFTVMSKLAQESGAINLSQGFPDYNCSPQLIKLVNDYMKRGNNQYAPMAGLPLLRDRIATKVNELHNADYNPDTEVTVTAGGTQAVFTALAAVIRPNDEVILFEPAYDSYAPTVKLLGGLVKAFEMSPPIYKIDWAIVKRMITSNTKMIILNSPNNPTGMVLDKEDINQLIDITRNTDILILSDEVYEHLVFEGRQHLSMAHFPELRKRSFIAASFGKLYHNTGWKMGYCIAPDWLTQEFRKVHQSLIFSVNTPVQYALADFMMDKDQYLELGAFFQEKRDYFAGLMRETRFNLLPCHGSYFQAATYSRISDEKDEDFAKRLTTEFGVACIPVSAFYNKGTDHGVLR